MGMSISEGAGDDDDLEESHEINVTPFIDVMLVLLIIFMIAAPLSTVDLPIDLPTSTATPQKKPDKPTYVSIKPDLAVAIGENMVKRVDLIRSLDAMPDMNKDKAIFLRAEHEPTLQTFVTLSGTKTKDLSHVKQGSLQRSGAHFISGQ